MHKFLKFIFLVTFLYPILLFAVNTPPNSSDDEEEEGLRRPRTKFLFDDNSADDKDLGLPKQEDVDDDFSGDSKDNEPVDPLDEDIFSSAPSAIAKAATDSLTIKTKSRILDINETSSVAATPTKKPPLLKIKTDPGPVRQAPKLLVKNPIYGKGASGQRCCQWVGQSDFTLKLKLPGTEREIIYSPFQFHLPLRADVDEGRAFFPKAENLFSVRLKFLVTPAEGQPKESTTIDYDLMHSHNGKNKRIIFVSGTEKEPVSDDFYFLSLMQVKEIFQVTEEGMIAWLKDIYKDVPTASTMIDKGTHAQHLHHSEQWAMYYLFKMIDAIIKDFSQKHKPQQVHGILIEGHT